MKLPNRAPPASPTRDSLVALVEQWLRAQPIASGLTVEDPARVNLPASLVVTITKEQPWRQQALEDARCFLASSTFYGWGMEVLLESDLRPTHHDLWSVCVSPLRFRTAWPRSGNMGGSEVDFNDGEFERVAVEDGCWRVVEVWNRNTREQYRTVVEMVLARRAKEAAAASERTLAKAFVRRMKRILASLVSTIAGRGSAVTRWSPLLLQANVDTLTMLESVLSNNRMHLTRSAPLQNRGPRR